MGCDLPKCHNGGGALPDKTAELWRCEAGFCLDNRIDLALADEPCAEWRANAFLHTYTLELLL